MVFPRPAGLLTRKSDDRERIEVAPEHRRAFRFEPVFQHPGIHTAEIRDEFDVALEQVGGSEAGTLAQQTSLHFIAKHEQGRGSAVVRALAAGLGDAPALARGEIVNPDLRESAGVAVERQPRRIR